MIENNNVTLSEYMGHLIREMVVARVMSDRYSAQVANVYSKDDMLKHFPVPRFKVSEMEINFPVHVTSIESQLCIRIVIEKTLFVNFIKDEINRLLKTYGCISNLDSLEYKQVLLKINELYHKVTMCRNSEELNNMLRKGYQEICFDVLSISTKNAYLATSKELRLQEIDNSLSTFQNVVTNFTVLEHPKLKSIYINPCLNNNENSSDSNQSSKIQFHIKLKEENIHIETIADENGNQSKIINMH